MTVTLIGHITYHLQCSNCNDGKSTTALDRNPHRDRGDETPKAGQKRTRSSSPRKQGGEKDDGHSTNRGDFCFTPEWEEDDSQNDANFSTSQEYHIVAHQSMLQSLIDAVRFRCKVKVAKYEIINGDILELHHEGLILCDSDTQLPEPISVTEYLSLKEFQDIELRQQNNDSKGKVMTKNINICGTVDSISPIIGAVPSDPFALIELYDETNDMTLTAVVILKGPDALLCQAGIQPGFRIKLKNVKRQKWHVSMSFQRKGGIPKRLWNRAPSHVFVVSEANSVEWDRPNSLNACLLDDFTLPSTVESLTCIQGRVVSVQYTDISERYSRNSRGACKTIHYITLNPIDGQTLMKLYLTYYPLSPMLTSGIRIGSMIRAVNIHSIQSIVFSELMKNLNLEYKCYAACLRSTVSIISPSSEYTNDRVKLKGLCPDATRSQHIAPHNFLNIRQSYFELEWMSLCRKQLSACSTGDKVIERTLRKLIYHNRERKSRDPFQEWFDHVCEDTHNCSCDDDCGCLMICPYENRFSGKSLQEIPFVIGLQKLHQQTVDVMIAKLSENLQTFSDRDFGVGCTASYHIQTEDLLHVFGLDDTAVIFVGGIIRRVDSKGRVLTACDKSCEVKFTPLKSKRKKNPDAKSLSKFQDGDFVLIKPHVVVISCLYLGSHNTQIQTRDISTECVRLPTLFTEYDRGILGPCSVLKIGHHLLLVSIQVLYDVDSVISTMSQRSSSPCEKLENNHHQLVHGDKRTYGRLLQQRWKVGKGNNKYIGCEIAFSLVDSTVNDTVVHLPAGVRSTLKIPVPSQHNETWAEIQTKYGIYPTVIKTAKAW
eukprot:CAMPEP_0176479972 /NCGR_PEP_ID=MMETSP0200_2-20121128/2031_1 /TAXON_ID=947934 /ORGANISM="Chaetoceros sp., Strain GSL56" /LENGTH=824 /DNA_ID=CAMNT_0017876065 /DNA_START=33 /DNA_END=2504 /DNA_ORIENTATION=-